MLSGIAAVVYGVVALVCGVAAIMVARLPERLRETIVWTLIVGLFVGLAVMRLTGAEAWATEHLRQSFQQEGLYVARRTYQRPIAALVLALSGLLLGSLIAVFAGKKRHFSPFVRNAALAAVGMVLLIAVRVVSYHPIDQVLYASRLHLNWVLDIGLTLMVAACAIRAADRARRATRGR